MQAAVQMNQMLAASALMKVINVLSDHGQPGHMFGKLSDSVMCSIWLRLNNLLPTPFIPLNNSNWVSLPGAEELGTGQAWLRMLRAWT
jgi:hypothetical protein